VVVVGARVVVVGARVVVVVAWQLWHVLTPCSSRWMRERPVLLPPWQEAQALGGTVPARAEPLVWQAAQSKSACAPTPWAPSPDPSPPEVLWQASQLLPVPQDV
jgi:hypothetical protein